jgi:16S rRNA (guanine(1405)-N(7))-methyltransferase
MDSSQPEELVRLVEVVRSGPKYARIAPEFITRLARRELGKRRSFKETVKAVRSKLHQVGGAYLAEELRYGQWLEEFKEATAQQNQPAIKEICLKAMRSHASTRERLGILDQFYEQIFAGLPPIRSILDIACGLNPLALPWMPLAQGAEYRAVDIYLDMMEFLDAFFTVIGMQGQASAADVIDSPPQQPADLVLVLKAIPCLEQVERSATEHLLSSLNGNYLLVSFPVSSLGGRKKGMALNYENRFTELAEYLGWSSYQRFIFPTELAFLVKR